MGGAAGHIQHTWENRDLTFHDLKEIIASAAEGKLEKSSEKCDGLNLVFTWDVSMGELRVARTGSDISRGGMGAAELAKKFFGRGNVETAFNTAFKVLADAIRALPPRVALRVFGDAGTKWYSLEIIYAPDPNTINYDSNNIVFHGWPIFEINDEGKVEQSDDDSGVSALTKNIDSMQKAISARDWRVRGPSLLRLKKMSDGSIVRNAISRIDAAMSDAGVGDNNTIGDYLRELMKRELDQFKLPDEVLDAAASRAMGLDGAPTVNDIKKAVSDKKVMTQLADVIRTGPVLQKQFILPIEKAIQQFAVEVLRGISSTLIDNSDKEVQRLQGQLARAIRTIEASGNQEAMNVLNTQLEKLGSVDSVSAPMEGIVFFYKGQAYKFTGSFAPLHQIMSLFKYGKKGVPPMDLGESELHKTLDIVIEKWRVFQ